MSVCLSGGPSCILWFPCDNFPKYYPISFKLGTCIILRNTSDGIAFGACACPSVCLGVRPAYFLAVHEAYFGFHVITFLNIIQFHSNLAHVLYLGIARMGLVLEHVRVRLSVWRSVMHTLVSVR